jgi:hypothetical protein
MDGNNNNEGDQLGGHSLQNEVNGERYGEISN